MTRVRYRALLDAACSTSRRVALHVARLRARQIEDPAREDPHLPFRKKLMMNASRRSFLRAIGAVAAVTQAPDFLKAAPDMPHSETLQRESQTNEPHPVTVALIGGGGMGTVDMETSLSVGGVRMGGVCDLYDGRLASARKTWGENLFVTKDYKEILKRKEIDAVIIGTPDHWHKQIGVDALNAGKHVYCEKPMVHSVSEGKEVIDAWKRSGKIFMVGSQGVSSLGNEKARQLLAEGAIGQLNYAEGFWARHSPEGAWQYAIPADASPTTVDWERFVANTTKRPFDPMRFFRWRNYLDYGTGMSGDLFVHLFSSLHFITNSAGPEEILATGGLRYWKDGREVPDVLVGTFNYPEAKEHPGFTLSLRCNFVDGTSGTTYLRLVGSEGSMDVKWEEVVVRRNDVVSDNDPFASKKAGEMAGEEGRKRMLPPKETVYRAEEGYAGALYDHHANFIRAIRSGTPVAEDPVFGLRAAAPALLCNESFAKKRFVRWDPVAMTVRS